MRDFGLGSLVLYPASYLWGGGLVFVSLLCLVSGILCHLSEKFWECDETSFVCAISSVEISFKNFVLGR